MKPCPRARAGWVPLARRRAHRYALGRVRLVAVAAVFISVGSVGASGAHAQGNPLIERGAEQLEDLEFEGALETLSAALVRSGNSDADRATIYRLLAFTYFALGRQEEAEGSYRSLLALDPDFAPGSDVAPRVREFFGAARSRWEADGRPGLAPPSPVVLHHRSPPEAERGDDVRLLVRVEDPARRVARVVLAYRQGTSAVFQRADAVTEGNAYVAILPGDAVRPPLVEYYFEALDAGGLPVASRGDVSGPLRITVPDPDNGDGGSVFSEWWFWAGVAVVVGGAATAAVFVATSDSGPGSGTFVVTVVE